jgi:PAS domain S-box-containing protein
VESSDDAVIGKDLEGRVVSWNRGAERMFGYNAEEMLGQTISVLLAPDGQAQENEVLEKVRRGEIARYETLRVCKDRRIIHISLTVSPIHDERGEIIGASSISRDITQRKLAEEENARLRNELEQRVRERTAELEAANREMEAFTYSVAHDLRAPLRHMDAFANVLKSDFADSLDPQAGKYIDKIVTGSQNMGRLVDDLLNLARVGRQELKKQLTSLNELLDQVLDELKEETRGRDIKWQINQLPRLECDPGLVRQVFANLLSNAVKYSRPRARAVIEVGSFDRDGSKVIYVRDNGVGFNMKYANKLFGVFQRLHRPEEFEGTGVGLATVERIIRKHGGRIWAEAELDKGATFFFTLG